MAVPSSGQLDMLKLAREKVYDNYNSSSGITTPISMYDLVNGGNTNGSGVSYDITNTASCSRPNTSTPHSMSEWYGYDHDASTSYSATMTVGSYYNSSLLAYGYGFSSLTYGYGSYGSINNVTFGCYTLTLLSWDPGNVLRIAVDGNSRPNFSSLTIGGVSVGGSSTWIADGINGWRKNYFGSPFGTTVGATKSIAATGIS